MYLVRTYMPGDEMNSGVVTSILSRRKARDERRQDAGRDLMTPNSLDQSASPN